MKRFIGGHQAVTDYDFLELALGTPPELWLGVEGETGEKRAARLDAARDILAEDPELPDRLELAAQSGLLPHLDDAARVVSRAACRQLCKAVAA